MSHGAGNECMGGCSYSPADLKRYGALSSFRFERRKDPWWRAGFSKHDCSNIFRANPCHNLVSLIDATVMGQSKINYKKSCRAPQSVLFSSQK